MDSIFYIFYRGTQNFLRLIALILFLSGPAIAQELSPASERLFEAVHEGDLAKIQVSIAGGADVEAVNAWGITAVDLAVDKGHFDIVHFLLQVRDIQRKQPKTVAAPPTIAATPITPGQPAPAPEPRDAEARVGEVIAPDPGSGPWSAIVVTTEPPPPPAPDLPAGPSPFDITTPVAKTGLPVIGTVRGPEGDPQVIDTNIQIAVEDTFQSEIDKPKPSKAAKTVPVPAPAPKAAPKVTPTPKAEAVEFKPVPDKVEDIPKQDGGVWSNIKNFLNLDTPGPEVSPEPKTQAKPVKKAAPTPKPAPQVAEAPAPKEPVPVQEIRRSATLAKPTAPVSPPGVSGTPPPIKETAILPKQVTAAPVSELSKDDLGSPQVMPVQAKPKVTEPKKAAVAPAPKKSEPEPLKPDTIRVTKLPDSEKTTPPKITRTEPPEEPVRVGTTTLPGKPPEQKGFFSKVMSIFSTDEDKKEEIEKKVAKSSSGQGGSWNVKEVEQAQVIPKKPSKKKVRELPDNRLDGVVLGLGRTTALGKEPPPQAPAPWYYRSCITKKMGSIAFCIEPLNWPKEIQPHFLTDSVMYEGTSSIVRYDEGAATYFHTLFPSQSYQSIVNYFTRRYGPPTQKLKRSIAPLAEQRKINPTVIWQSVAPVTNLLTTLEIRMYDDNRGGFPDTKRGGVYLYHEWSQTVFPQLSSVELMLLRAEAKQR